MAALNAASADQVIHQLSLYIAGLKAGHRQGREQGLTEAAEIVIAMNPTRILLAKADDVANEAIIAARDADKE